MNCKQGMLEMFMKVPVSQQSWWFAELTEQTQSLRARSGFLEKVWLWSQCELFDVSVWSSKRRCNERKIWVDLKDDYITFRAAVSISLSASSSTFEFESSSERRSQLYLNRSSVVSAMDHDYPSPPPPSEPAPAGPPPPPALSTSAGSPTDFLKGVVGKKVVVRLTSGVDYRGMWWYKCSFESIFVVQRL